MHDMMHLVEPMIPALRRYARSMVRDRAAADDLVQDCLERTISHWHQRRTDSDARSWVFTILHNLAINQLRQKARRGWHGPIDDVAESTLAQPAAQEHGLHHRDLLKALDSLPEDQRSVLLLVSVEDLSYADAASVLGVPVGTVMSRLSRAREKLLQAMDGEGAHGTGHMPKLRSIK